MSAGQQRAARCVPRRTPRAVRCSPRRTPRVSSARVAANHERRRAQLAATHAGHPRATRRSPRRTPRAARVARGAKPSCSLTSVPRRSVALHHRRIDFALIHAASRLFHLIAHSTLHRKSRSPRQRARGLRPSCHPALRAGVLGGDGSAARGGRQPARSARQRRAPAAQRAAIHARQPRAIRRVPRTPSARNSPRPTHASRAPVARNSPQPTHAIRTPSARNSPQSTHASRAQLAATHAGRRARARVARGAKPSCSLTSVPRRSVALRHRRNVRPDSRRLTPLPIASRIPRSTERAGLRVREHEGFAPRATRPFGPASWAGMGVRRVAGVSRLAARVSGARPPRNARQSTHASRAQLAASHARQPRAIPRSPRRTPRASAGGTRGEALVLSDIRTAPIGCASSPAH